MTRYTGGCLCGAIASIPKPALCVSCSVIVLTVRSTQARLSYLEWRSRRMP